MKTYTGKTIEEALQEASLEQETDVENLVYIVSDKKVGIFNKKFIIEVYDLQDIVAYAENYIKDVIKALEVDDEPEVSTNFDDSVIRITVDSKHNPILIGKNGKTLQAFNELVKLATSNHFHKRFRILVDINGYKNNKYTRLAKIARRCAHDVQKTKQTYSFDPMPSDERRTIHNACSGMPHIHTESIGDGINRKVQIIYVD